MLDNVHPSGLFPLSGEQVKQNPPEGIKLLDVPGGPPIKSAQPLSGGPIGTLIKGVQLLIGGPTGTPVKGVQPWTGCPAGTPSPSRYNQQVGGLRKPLPYPDI